ncbi:unnamed protein product [Kluyveromyces dobzhanskii CBS 2104]|uniref:WGS project CCBQ000000000 data, contig 00107 n=1 Tax=Kluyveromyces dobzhanskii CBS 2104 TaxID=1427455 RepID=A0A0A8KZ55_9SACH|nr:unnamed protein product [Kluyveromyces dobzhanskii CBS 2104]
MASQQRSKSNKSASVKRVGKGSNSLFGRVGKTTGQNPVSKRKQAIEKVEKPKTGLTFHGGKLVLSTDLQTQKVTSNKHRNQPNNMRGSTRANPKERANSRQQVQGNKKKQPNTKLVISLKDTFKCLKIRNLPIGTNKTNLQRVLQQMGNCKVTDLKVIDLPTGSAHAEVFGSNIDLETLHMRFNQAEIDGRRILTEISTQPEL